MSDDVRRYGLVSVEAHPRESRFARVTLNGVDVTRSAFAAHDEEGWVDRFVHDANGLVLNSDKTAVQTERLFGDVVIAFPDMTD